MTTYMNPSRTVQDVFRVLLTALAATALLLVSNPGALAQDAFDHLELELVADGFTSPVALVTAPGDARRFVVDQIGLVHLLDEDGNVHDTPFLDVRDRLMTFRPGFDERGLLGLAFHPDYESNGLFYAHYSAPLRHGALAALNHTSHVSEFRVSEDDPNVADHASERVVLAVDQPAFNHDGGEIAFGPDGYLYIASANPDPTAHRHPDSRPGVILRIDVDSRTGTLPYGIPADNPFVGRPGARPEIWSYGHRNVQGIVRDPDSGRIYAHEHGPRGGDELNLIEAGGNYGWPAATQGIDYSGAMITPHTDLPGMRAPLIDWTPSIAPSGMTLYRGELFPAWQGSLFVSALAAGDVRRIELDATGRPVAEETLFADLGERIRDVRSGPDGALYLLTDRRDGRVLRVVPAD
jgi:glucose/arabinose dehydrogenase